MGKLFGDNVTSLDFAEFAADLMKAVNDGDFEAATAGIINDEPAIRGTQVYRATNDRPQMLIAHGPTRGVAFVAGATNAALAGKVWGGYFEFDPLPTRTALRNRYTVAVGDFVLSEMASLGVLAGAPKVFVGHSFGGTVAQYCANSENRRGGTSTGFHCSFGSPKWLRPDDARVVGDTPGARWFNDNDPVPLFPFTVRDSLLTLLVLNPVMQRQLAEFVQARGGVQLYANGNHDPEVLPTAATTGEILNFANWILSQDSTVTSPHAMSEYVRRLRIAADNARQPLAAVRLSVEQEQPATSHSRLYTQAETRVATAVSNAQSAQNRPVLNIPQLQLFRVVRNGRVFVVTFGDVAVFLTSQRRTARSVARQWNVALRHMQSQAYVSPENLLKQMTAYLEAAADPNSGFSPQLATTLPL